MKRRTYYPPLKNQVAWARLLINEETMTSCGITVTDYWLDHARAVLRSLERLQSIVRAKKEDAAHG